MDADLLKDVPGGPELIAWFGGRLPSFHDAEVVEVLLERRDSRCRLKIHGFEITSDLDEKGYFKSIRHAVVTFHLDRVSALELADFNHQNVIDRLSLTQTAAGGFLLQMEPCYGLFGKVEAASLRISLEPGIPEASVYTR